MLNTDTKQNILRARNILVGVVPMPSAQIEQITYAMLYKFMDDMDQQSIAIGGKPSFFEGEWGKYAWSNMFDPRVGGFELHSLYTDALQAIPRNPNIPQFIRTIFKNAILPYRNPETLKLFLKIINEFEFTTADHFGDAFEHLLQTWGSQGDAGQFLTPRHIINFMVEVVDPQKDESILDPACGTAGFLIAAFRHILDHNTQKVPGDQLSNDERTTLMGNLTGYDISGEMVRLALTNLYLHGFPNPRVLEYDTLTSEDHWDQYFNVILANPPFMTPTGGIRPHKRFGVQANRSEVLFVDYIAEHLTPDGRAAIIVPEGIIFQSGKAYKQLRKMLVEQNYLWAVVSLPAGVFNPYSGVKTSILFLDKALARKTDQIVFVKIENDGFSLGANRNPSEKDDLPRALSFLHDSKSENHNSIRGLDVQSHDYAFPIEKQQILQEDTVNLSLERYQNTKKVLARPWSTVSLGDEDLFSVLSGGTPDTREKDYWDGDIPWITLVDIPNHDMVSRISATEKRISSLGLKNSGAKIIPPGSIIVSTRATIGRIGVNKIPVATNQGFKNIVVKNVSKVDPTFIAYMMTMNIPEMLNLASGGTFKEISKTNFCKLEIPLPPLDVQRKTVDEIEACQRIIDGARMVVDNWKPNLAHELELARKSAGVDEWPRVKLGEIANNLDSKRKPVTKSDRTKGVYPYYGASGIVDFVENYIFDGDYLLISEDGANLLARSTPIAFSIKGKNWVNNHAHVLQFENLIFQTFVEVYINSIDISNYVTGSAQPKLNQASLCSIKIPQPPYDVQSLIVEKIKQEMSAIESNRKLIEMYEEKIRQIIARVWEG